MYSATRQWNPGDEFILAGARRIIDTALGEFHPVIYDRNPDIRPGDGRTVAFRNLKRPIGETDGAAYEELSAYLRLGFAGNSVKFDSDLSYATLAVVAGSPEWATPRCWSFYDHIFRNRLPLVALGLGSMPEDVPAFVHAALANAAVITTRSRALAESDLATRYDVAYLPCPALLSAPATRPVTAVRRVGLVIGVPYGDAVWANGLDEGFYESVCRAVDGLIAQFGDSITFDLIAHYIDELPVLRRRFPQHAVRYSYDSRDYVEIFDDYDLVISTRVHGCGLAASMGTPTISLGHDFRSDTTDGFLSVPVDVTDDPTALVRAFEDLAGRAAEVSRELIVHRANTLESYVTLIRSRMAPNPDPVDYGAGGVVPLTTPDSHDSPEGLTLTSAMDEIGHASRELHAARESNHEMRGVLTAVEESKAEMALELDGARAAVDRLENELAQVRADLAARGARRRWGRHRRRQ